MRLATCAVAAVLCGCVAPDMRAAPGARDTQPAERRHATVADVASLRRIDTLSVSPDGSRYAILVRHADADANVYRTEWLAGSTQGGALVRLGDGGEPGPRAMFTGHMPGVIEASPARWSPDGQWIAFTARRGGAVQLWRSRADGGQHEQVTQSAADVHDFAWSEEGRALYFTTGLPRHELAARAQARAREGYRFDEDLWHFTDFMAPQMIRPPETAPGVRVVVPGSREERAASGAESAAFEQAVAPRAPAKSPDDTMRDCAQAGTRLICVRETAELPPHVAAVEPGSGDTVVLADVNPQFRNLQLGRVERFEWDTPRFPWNEKGGALAGVYPARTHGYILYPPDFDPARKYPVFIDAYMATGFTPLGAEHALQAYAAAGIVVLRLQLPLPTRAVGMAEIYSEKLGYPHLTMLMESTRRGLELVEARGFVDRRRVGIGGVSHGSFVPLYLMQKHDRIAAISVASPSWGPLQHYGPTRKARDTIAQMTKQADEFSRRPDGPGRTYWSRIDIADHVETIEAPILLQLAAQETFAMVRLIRHLADAGKPYDAYVFADETHIKWQPAHLHTILQRNHAWFRFWLQDHDEDVPARWHRLREQQCRNRRSLRDYCAKAGAR